MRMFFRCLWHWFERIIELCNGDRFDVILTVCAEDGMRSVNWHTQTRQFVLWTLYPPHCGRASTSQLHVCQLAVRGSQRSGQHCRRR